MMSAANEEIRHQQPRINYFSCVKGPTNMDNNMLTVLWTNLLDYTVYLSLS